MGIQDDHADTRVSSTCGSCNDIECVCLSAGLGSGDSSSDGGGDG